jgi:Family of unknown function (DUF5681)
MPKQRRRKTKGKWQPGESGNPKGRVPAHKIFSNLATEARKYADKALETVVELMGASNPANIRLAAAREVLDRGFGRAAQTLDLKADVQSTSLNPFADISPADQGWPVRY